MCLPQCMMWDVANSLDEFCCLPDSAMLRQKTRHQLRIKVSVHYEMVHLRVQKTKYSSIIIAGHGVRRLLRVELFWELGILSDVPRA